MKIDATAILYEEMSLNIRNGGDDMAQYENMTFSRQQLYDEIWSISTSRVAKKYSIPYDKLKKACKDANIPTPTQSYWSSLSIGKEVEKESLPPSEVKEAIVQYSIKSKDIIPSQINVAKVIEEAVLQSIDLQKVQLKTQPQRTYVEGQRNVYDREILYNEVWNGPVTTVAKRYGVSDVAIHKVCKSLYIPVPPRGYWAMKNAGQPVKQVPLPEIEVTLEVHKEIEMKLTEIEKCISAQKNFIRNWAFKLMQLQNNSEQLNLDEDDDWIEYEK